MAVNDSFTESVDALADAGDLIVDGSEGGTGAINVTEFGATGAVDVYREVDPDGDGTFEVSVNIDTQSGNWHSQGNDLIASQSQNVRIRLNNTSGGTIDVYAAGYEVDD